MLHALTSTDSYDKTYFAWQLATAKVSAAAMLPAVLALLPSAPRSVVDVGCGTGVWAAEAKKLGADVVIGLDGGYNTDYLIPPESFVATDLSRPLPELRAFDFAICLEVAVHLPAARAASLVRELCGLAPVVLFSAAIPEQGGPDSAKFHVNERWQSEWAALFAECGHRPVDLVRPVVWEDDRISWWYRQNAFLAVAPNVPVDGPPVRDVVHPDAWKAAVGSLWTRSASPSALLKQLPRALRHAARRRTS
jgi:SAM-dependent methyltransferase